MRQQHHRLRQALGVALLALLTPFALAESEYAAAWGPSVGSSVPLLEATDQDGNLQNLETLSRSNGLLFVFNRSVDW
ncbi:MAG: hypothetical protein AAF513_02715 [Pseudomonadota bacterium]